MLGEREQEPNTKKPPPPRGGEGRRVSRYSGRVRRRSRPSGADAPREYENSTLDHEPESRRGLHVASNRPPGVGVAPSTG
ncbi:MAG: hypothetical protein AVDCRST_MAG54-2294 [uncultured Actinomycetospora sp.]|uniref:Uncharacterized protein n=1 Tax=uncultured Actinomycetospora sp. TaxID=1135996 RepID=A0A6J4IQS7_9PSEU|nr:MAG: hypothetical protein AVDCRST_MAG54-2294 [uncultured Actinomycetospora sp.]